MRFTKMHGLGNDYVYVDCFQEPMPSDPADLARRIADRHFGVGGDGLILICPSEQADARMRMFNADGSEAEMCGNGIRCVAKYVYDHGIARKPQLAIETGNGILTLDLEIENELVKRVRVDMGRPILEAGRIPMHCPACPLRPKSLISLWPKWHACRPSILLRSEPRQSSWTCFFRGQLDFVRRCPRTIHGFPTRCFARDVDYGGLDG